MSHLGEVLTEVSLERSRQDKKWGEQNHPDGTLVVNYGAADQARRECEKAAKAGKLTWFHILSEEYWESQCELEPAKIRAELIQVAAVAIAWVQAIDRRP